MKKDKYVTFENWFLTVEDNYVDSDLERGGGGQGRDELFPLSRICFLLQLSPLE